VASVTPLTKIKQLETVINSILRTHDVQALERETQKAVAHLKRELTDARLDIRDAEFADTGEDYRRHVSDAKARLVKVNKSILNLSSDGLFKPVDVAELSAKLDQLSSEL
jgi:hypothetical protein